jgi:hypothetical protein
LIKKDFFCFPVLTQNAQAGLIRASCSTACKGHAQIAQSVEQWIENPRVPGSIPGLGTIIKVQVVAKLPEHLKKPAFEQVFYCLQFPASFL